MEAVSVNARIRRSWFLHLHPDRDNERIGPNRDVNVNGRSERDKRGDQSAGDGAQDARDDAAVGFGQTRPRHRENRQRRPARGSAVEPDCSPREWSPSSTARQTVDEGNSVAERHAARYITP